MWKKCYNIFILFALIFSACSREFDTSEDMLTRARIDGLNKEAFLERYRDPECALDHGYDALDLINDSLPLYDDGRLRAWNSLAFDYFILGKNDSAYACLQQVLDFRGKSSNREVEQVIAQLLRARLEQRDCRIANSYQILYDIDRSRILDKNSENYLFSYALMEYYITSLTLNYHYRNGALDNVEDLLAEIEQRRGSLSCDYAEDMALNYAMAHAFYRLSASHAGDIDLLKRSLAYLDESIKLLGNPDAYCDYHQANVYQLLAFITADTAIRPDPPLDMFDSVTFGLDMFKISTEMFFLTPDPYQHLGAVVSAADYCMLIGDTALAWDYYNLAVADSTWTDGFAPKFESMLYRGLIASGYSTSHDENNRWFARELDLLDYIQQNEKADFILQNELDRARGTNRIYAFLLCGIALLLLGMLILFLKLRKSSKALQEETVRLQLAKQKDVERIANVETCLSVLRHDITPFVSYLQNKNLPEELKNEVMSQLLRTFENIKNWTNLSIPSGLQFRESEVSVQEIFDAVQSSVPNFRGKDLSISFHPSSLAVRADRQLLEILLRNLVKNAIQYTEKGKVDISACVSPENPQFALFAVADTGRGMSDEEVENIFRTDKKIHDASENGYGSGFGLILSRYIVKKHDDNTLRGCRIWAESQLGSGSIFYFMIPLISKTE